MKKFINKDVPEEFKKVVEVKTLYGVQVGQFWAHLSEESTMLKSEFRGYPMEGMVWNTAEALNGTVFAETTTITKVYTEREEVVDTKNFLKGRECGGPASSCNCEGCPVINEKKGLIRWFGEKTFCAEHAPDMS